MFSNKLKLKLVLISSLVLSGCSWFTSEPQKVEIRTVPVERIIYEPSRPEPVSLVAPKWHVVTKSNLDEFWGKLEKQQGTNPVFFAFTPKDYEAMSYNIQEFRRIILEYIKIVEYYEKMNDPKIQDSEHDVGVQEGKENIRNNSSN